MDGQVDVNGADFNPLAPFGGWKNSGLGRELGRVGIDEYTDVWLSNSTMDRRLP